MSTSGVRSISKAWLAEFLFTRELVSGPNGSPLYLYQVTEIEYDSLGQCLGRSKAERNSPAYSAYWGAAFCLFVAEKYRREYDAREGGWSWQGFERALQVTLSPQERRELVLGGLAYWQRPVRERATGLDYLGSLFDEGGLPWKLVQSESHGFGRAVRSGLRKYYKTKQAGADLIEDIRAYEKYFPKTFRTAEKYRLIASIVEWLMRLAENYPISEQEDPAAYLDQNARGWRAGSPLPVGEDNGKALVNEWLRAAGERRKERKQVEEDAKNFTCEHFLRQESLEWSLISEAYLPRTVIINSEEGLIQSTRVEVAFFEGAQLLSSSGIVYGRVSDDRRRLEVTLSARKISIPRKNPQLPLTIQFLSNGQRIHAEYFDDSEIDYQNLPMIFLEDGGDTQLLGTTSTEVASEAVLIRLPNGMSYESESVPSTKGIDSLQGRWLEATSDITLIGGESLRVRVRLNGNAVGQKPVLKGAISLYDTLPNLAYRGWPHVQFRSVGGDEGVNSPHILADGVPVTSDFQKNRVGTFQLSVVGTKGDTLLRRKLGVLPADLSITALPASSRAPARLLIRSGHPLKLCVSTPSLRSEYRESEGEQTVLLAPKHGMQAPENISLDITDGFSSCEPVTVRMPFPQSGVQVFDGEGNSVTGNKVVMNELLGMGLIFTPQSDSAEVFHIILELSCPKTTPLSRHYSYLVHGQPARISLFALLDDLQQMLGASPEQDAEIKLRIETDRPLRQLFISRYKARISRPDANGIFEIESDGRGPNVDSAKVSGMRLDDPAAASVSITERTSQGVGMDAFEIPEKMMKNGPWLIFPDKDSAVQFRPAVWVTSDTSKHTDDGPAVRSLHAAAKEFHPKLNPAVFENVIQQMADDVSHSGWEYLFSLKDHFSYLPLSVFESWRALALDQNALAMAVFRLEMDDAFCRRLSNELSVVWESVTIDAWLGAQKKYKDQFAGMPEDLVQNFVDTRRNGLANLIPCFQCLHNYLSEPKLANLEQHSFEIIPFLYQGMRRRHADDDRWPDAMAKELTHWINEQDLPDAVRRVADIGFAQAVTYMPVFMAQVTAGKASLSDLTDDLVRFRFSIRLLSDFDRDDWYQLVYGMVLSHLLLNAE